MVSYRNVGKSPALYIWTPEFIVEHGPNSQKMIDKYFEFLDTQDVSKINSEYDSSVLVPEIPTDTSTFQSHPAYGLGALTTDDVQNISTQKEFVFVAGRINYKDMAKNSYHSDFCIVINNDNNYANCQNHNDIQ
jgi:hypothetical protein